MTGQMIGHYRILEEIGRGGMGVVYKAYDTRLNRPVAIKALQADDEQAEAARRRFLREARTVAGLDHPYICKIYEILEHQGHSYIVLEFVRGKPLSALMTDAAQPAPLEKILDVGREVAEALEEAHRNGIVHRDIKPTNIMLLESGHIKVLDFGLARPLPELGEEGETVSGPLTDRDMVMGTPPYMAPEQFTGQPADQRSDIFSFGVVLFELIAGRRPFAGASAAQLATAIMTEATEPLHRYRHGVPDGLDHVIRRMLAKDPNERYQSVHEVWVELRHVGEELATQSSSRRTRAAGAAVADVAATVTTGPSTAPVVPQTSVASVPRAGSRRLSRRALVWATGVLSVVAVVIGVLWYQGRQPALSFAERDWVLLAEFENVTGDAIFDKTLATALNVSLMQSKYVNVFSRSRINTVLQRMGKKADTVVDEQIGREVCQRENIRGLICPTIGKVGNKFIVTARIVDPQTGDSIRSYAHEASDYNGVLTALDDVAASLRGALGESLAQVGASNRPLQKVTTRSLTALKAYSDAQYLWSKGQREAGVEQYEAAVKEDPEFAMAHAALGVAYGSFIYNDQPRAKEHLLKALNLADRVTDRERMAIRLRYSSGFGTPAESRTLYENYLRTYPDSVTERYNYANVLRDSGELDRAVEQYQEVIRIAPDHASAIINLATTYSMQGKTKESLATYARAFKLEPTWVTNGNLNHEYGFVFVDAGDYEQARQVFEKGLASSIKPQALRSMALLDLYQGKYRDAKKLLDEAIVLNVSEKERLTESRNHLFMAILLDGQADASAAQAELDKGIKCLETLPPQPWFSAGFGVSYARGTGIDKAIRILEKARKDINPNDRADNAAVHRLEGEIELARGNRAKAVALLTLADREDHTALTLESLARAQRIAGMNDDATATYEALMALRVQAGGWEPQQLWLTSHLDLAKLHIAKKEPEKARRVLQELLGYWKAADPDLPVYKEALRLNQTLAGR